MTRRKHHLPPPVREVQDPTAREVIAKLRSGIILPPEIGG